MANWVEKISKTNDGQNYDIQLRNGRMLIPVEVAWKLHEVVEHDLHMETIENNFEELSEKERTELCAIWEHNILKADDEGCELQYAIEEFFGGNAK